MDDTDLLHACMQAFLSQRDAFRTLVVDSRGRPVNDDRVQLRCGRTLQDVIAMIVRTHAKRHFRRVLGGNPNDPASHAGRSYQALQEYLLHEWQVLLVPHYAPLPAARLNEIGPGLLDLRTPQALAEAFGTAAPAAPEPAPAPVAPIPGVVPAPVVPAPVAAPPVAAPPVAPPAPRPAASPGLPARRPVPVGAGAAPGSTPQETFWWEALSDRSVKTILGDPGMVEMREMVAALAGVNNSVRSDLFAALSLSTHQAGVFLGTAWKTLGRQGFQRLFGTPGKPQVIAELAERLLKRGVGSRTDLKTLARLAETVIRG